MSPDLRLAVGLVILFALACAAPFAVGVDRKRDVLTASVRAAVQLAIVAAALRGVFAHPPFVVLALAVMFAVATGTAARRLRSHEGALRAVLLACGAGSAVTVAVIVGLPTLDRSVRTLVAVAGIVLGGTMTAATLTGRRLADGLRRRRSEVEAWLALGATPRRAVLPVAQDAVREALLPGLDQTRTVGLVTLPGAFIGALLGGAGAAQAARFQVVVLIGLLCAQAITATVLAHLLGAPSALEGEAGEEPPRRSGWIQTRWRRMRPVRSPHPSSLTVPVRGTDR